MKTIKYLLCLVLLAACSVQLFAQTRTSPQISATKGNEPMILPGYDVNRAEIVYINSKKIKLTIEKSTSSATLKKIQAFGVLNKEIGEEIAINPLNATELADLNYNGSGDLTITFLADITDRQVVLRLSWEFKTQVDNTVITNSSASRTKSTNSVALKKAKPNTENSQAPEFSPIDFWNLRIVKEVIKIGPSQKDTKRIDKN